MSARPEIVRKDTIATGPVASCGELPKRVAIITGIEAAYKPYTGGRPAIRA